MAILSATELKASPEAAEAGVNTLENSVVESAITVAEAVLNKSLGYKVANADTTLVIGSAAAERLALPQRVSSVSAITETFEGGSPSDVSDYFEVRGGGFSLWRRARWRDNATVTITGTFGFPTDSDEYVLAKRFVLLLAVRMLEKTSGAAEFPTPAGAVLTSFSSEQADFQFFTPTSESTGYQDLDTLLDLIGRHPNKKPGLFTISITRGSNVLTFDDVIAGREGLEGLG